MSAQPEDKPKSTGDGGTLDHLTELGRAIVRPALTLTGWMVLLYLVVKLAVTFVDKDMATVIIALFTGSLTTFIGFWFAERSRRE